MTKRRNEAFYCAQRMGNSTRCIDFFDPGIREQSHNVAAILARFDSNLSDGSNQALQPTRASFFAARLGVAPLFGDRRAAELVLVRPMQRILLLFLVSIAASLAIGGSHSDFDSLSEAAAEKYTLPNHVGSQYAEKFSDWSTEAMLHAMKVCESHPPSNRYCNIVAVVAADGHVRRLMFSPSNSYVDCVRKDLRRAVAQKPPGDNWPVQIRLLDGPRPKPKAGDRPFIILSAGHVE